jgi:prophage regulatory protein
MFNANITTGRQTTNAPLGPITILRLPAVKAGSGYSRSTVYLRIAQGLWTKQISLGPRCVGWPDYECAALNAARISGKTDAEIRDLVVKLEAARKGAV